MYTLTYKMSGVNIEKTREFASSAQRESFIQFFQPYISVIAKTN